MSKYTTQTTVFTDATLLVSALRRMGYPVEYTGYALNLNGYNGTTTVADIVVRKEHLRGYKFGDLGFTLDPVSGTYVTVVDDLTAEHSAKWQDELADNYTLSFAYAQAESVGASLESLERDPITGEITLVLAQY